MKNSEYNPLNQVLKDQLGEGVAPVPDFVWDQIEKELFPKKKRRFFGWWFFGGLCMLLTGVFCIAAFFQGGDDAKNASFSQNVQHTVSIKSATSAEKSEKSVPITAWDSFKTKGRTQYRAFDSNRGVNETKSFSRFTFSKQKITRKNPTSFQGKSSVQTFPNLTTSQEQSTENTLPNTHFTDPKREDLLAIEDHPVISPVSENHTPSFEKRTDTRTDSLPGSHSFTYAEALALVERDFHLENKEETSKNFGSRWLLGIYGGPSLYRTATFKDYFTSGQLSERTFASSGFELGLQAQFKLGNRFRVYAGLAFNQKNTQFNYILALQESDYQNYLANGQRVPLSHIHDDGANSCYFVKDVIARYRIQSTQFSLGTHFEFLKLGKFSANAAIRLSCNLNSSLKVTEIRVLDIPGSQSEQFSYLQPGIGIGLNYQATQRISIGLAPLFSKQFYLKESFSLKMDELVIPVTVLFEL